MAKIQIQLHTGVGIYGTDAQGNPWASFGVVGGEVDCIQCGKPISQGWHRYSSNKDTDAYFCSEHIKLLPPPVTYHQPTLWTSAQLARASKGRVRTWGE